MAWISVIFIGVMSILYILPKFIDRIYYVEEYDEDSNVCLVQSASWLKEKLYFTNSFW